MSMMCSRICRDLLVITRNGARAGHLARGGRVLRIAVQEDHFMPIRDPRRMRSMRIDALLLALCCAVRVMAADDSFTTHMDSVTSEPSDKPRVGETVVITCRWSAKFFQHGANEGKTVFEIPPSPPTNVWAQLNVKYQDSTKAFYSKQSDSKAKPGYYTADHPLAGEFKFAWVPAEAGAALATCVVSGPFDKWQARSKKQLPLWIFQPRQEISGAADAPAAAVPGLALPPAKVSIEGATATPTGNCRGVLPHAVAVIRLQLRNAGMALPAGRGVASAKCCSGFVGNPGVYLPAIGPGQTVTVEVPVGFTQAFSGGPAYLSGATKNFTVLVKPTNPDGFAPPPAQVVSVSFPPGNCDKRSRGASAGRHDPW
jgi:hypothetical protein